MANYDYSKYFTGRVIVREYAQALGAETVPTVMVNGVATRWATHVYTAKVVEKTYRFLGLSYSMAHSTSPITVEDLGGVQHTITPVASVNGSVAGNGSTFLESSSTVVHRIPITPHMWMLEVVVRNTQNYQDGSPI